MFVLSIVEDEGWTQPTELDDDAWRNLAANVKEIEAIAAGDGLTVALHPHVGTLVETHEKCGSRSSASMSVVPRHRAPADRWRGPGRVRP